MSMWLVLLLLILMPVLLAAVALVVPSNQLRPWIMPISGALHLAVVIHLVITTQAPGAERPEAWGGWLVLDPVGKLFLLYISVFYLIIASYAPAYLSQRKERPNRVLCATMTLSLGIMTLVILSHHLGLMWVAMEGTTLVTAPAIYFNHNPRSLEATWKYLLVCSVGIALALFGSCFLAYAALYAGEVPTLLLEDLIADADNKKLSLEWFHAAFVLLFVGYGTKMGLAPMHTWKPDAYGEAPGMIGAMMAGGMTCCAFLAILRVYQIAVVAHDEKYVQGIMVFFGLLSMVVAAVYMARQRDIKRMLAYSSVEHMGMLVFGIGIGGAATAGALQHVIHNGLTKGVLFLAAANIHREFGSKFTDKLKGVLRRLPFSGAMLMLGMFAITGSPPFAPFVSEFRIILATFATGQNNTEGCIFVACMLLVFFGMGYAVVSICFGEPTEPKESSGFHDSIGTGLPILVSFALVLILGVYQPPFLETIIDDAVGYLGNVNVSRIGGK